MLKTNVSHVQGDATGLADKLEAQITGKEGAKKLSPQLLLVIEQIVVTNLQEGECSGQDGKRNNSVLNVFPFK